MLSAEQTGRPGTWQSIESGRLTNRPGSPSGRRSGWDRRRSQATETGV